MKQVKLEFASGGRVRILAEGPLGKGTEKFTESLARALGRIEERHKGHHHTHTEVDTHVHVHQER